MYRKIMLVLCKENKVNLPSKGDVWNTLGFADEPGRLPQVACCFGRLEVSGFVMKKEVENGTV